MQLKGLVEQFLVLSISEDTDTAHDRVNFAKCKGHALHALRSATGLQFRPSGAGWKDGWRLFCQNPGALAPGSCATPPGSCALTNCGPCVKINSASLSPAILCPIPTSLPNYKPPDRKS